MATKGLGIVGEQNLSPGQLAPPTLDHYGYMVGGLFATSSSFAAAVERGRVFLVAHQTGVTTQAGLDVTPTLAVLSNPAGSGVTGRLWHVSVSILVSPAAAATVWLVANTNTVGAVVTGTITTAHRCGKLGGITPASQGNRVVALLTATLPVAPVVIDVLGVGLTGAISLLPSLPALKKCYYGALLIQPGTTVGIQTSSAGGASGTVASYVWEECDLIP